MNCQNCHQPLDPGAAYCGNCGQPVTASQPVPSQPLVQMAAAPAYALATPAQHAGETQSLLAIVLGVAGIIGALFMALVGLLLGLVGVVFGTLALNTPRRRLAVIGIVIASLAIIAGLASWAYVVRHDSRLSSHSSQPATTNVASELSTPCYSAGFVDRLTISNSSDSCDMSAFNGETLDASTNAYKIYANHSNVTDANSFMSLAKQALEKDVATNLPTFTIDSQRVSRFAGSPAYIVSTSDKAHNFAVTEAVVMRKVRTGDNVFVILHANDGKSADLDILESQWRWK